MLDKRNINYRYVDLNPSTTPKYLISNLPILEIDGIKYKARDALIKIKELK